MEIQCSRCGKRVMSNSVTYYQPDGFLADSSGGDYQLKGWYRLTVIYCDECLKAALRAGVARQPLAPPPLETTQS